MRTPSRRTARSHAAATLRYMNSEAYRKVALAGGGARETARRAKRKRARYDTVLDPEFDTNNSEALIGPIASADEGYSNTEHAIATSEVLLGKSHTQRLIEGASDAASFEVSGSLK